MKKTIKYKRVLALALVVCMLYSGCGSKNLVAGVSIVEFDTVEALAAIDRETLKNSENTLYKVGDNYYAFFPSTGKMELVTQVQEYDEQSIAVIEALYNGTVAADGVGTKVNEACVASVTTLDSVLNTRTEYLERELDNCNANMLIEGSDTVALAEYKAQLETELSQLTSYKQSLINTTELVVQSLHTQEVQDALLKQVSDMLDKQLVSLAEQYAYNSNVGSVTVEDFEALERIVATQQEFIELAQERYADVDALLGEKRVTIDSATDIVDTDAFKSVIAQLDTHAATYVAECERLYNSLSMKAEALESLYVTIQTESADGVNTVILDALQTQYSEMLNKQTDLQKQIETLTAALENVNTSTETGETTDGGVYSLLQEQLNKHNAELTALEEVLEGTKLETIDSLAGVQNTLQERIDSLEKLQGALKETMTQQQIDALKDLKTELQSSITDETTDVANDLRGYIDTLNDNYTNFGATTQEAIDALRNLLDSSTAAQGEINTAVNGLIGALNEDIGEQQRKLDAQKETLTQLINTTTGAVSDDLNTLKEAYNTYTQTNDGTVSGIRDDVDELSDDYVDYKQNNNDTVTGIRDDVDNLSDDYTNYKQNNTDTVTGIRDDVNELSDDYTNYKQNTADTVTCIRSDLNDVTDTVQDNSTAVFNLNRDLTALTNAYNAYTQNNTADVGDISDTVGVLNDALSELDTDYAAFKESTGTTIQSIDTLLSVVKTATDTNTSNVSDLQTAVGKLKDETVANLATVQAQLVSDVDTLKTSVSANYTELSGKVDQLAVNVSSLKTLTGTHDTKIGTLETAVDTLKTTVSSLKTSVETLQTDLSALQETIADRIPEPTDADKNKFLKADGTWGTLNYSLPTATTTKLGGVKVDGSTISIKNGVISATNAKLLVQSGTCRTSFDTRDLGCFTIDFPTAYKNAPVVSMYASDEVWVSGVSISSTGVTGRCYTGHSSYGVTEACAEVYWCAIGEAK